MVQHLGHKFFYKYLLLLFLHLLKLAQINQLIDEMKNSEIFKSVMDKFPDAELIDVNSNKDGVDNDWF